MVNQLHPSIPYLKPHPRSPSLALVSPPHLSLPLQSLPSCPSPPQSTQSLTTSPEQNPLRRHRRHPLPPRHRLAHPKSSRPSHHNPTHKTIHRRLVPHTHRHRPNSHRRHQRHHRDPRAERKLPHPQNSLPTIQPPLTSHPQWAEREHEDHLFGHLKGRSRWLTNLDEISDPYLKEGWLDVDSEKGGPNGEIHIESSVINEEKGWTAQQVWGFAIVDGKRYYVRRVLVTKGKEVLKVRLVYNWQGKQ